MKMSTNNENKVFYAIAEILVLDSSYDSEPVVCIPLGLYEDIMKAEEKCEELNGNDEGREYEVVGMNLKD